MFLIALNGAACVPLAQAQVAGDAPPAEASLMERTHLSGDWWGARTRADSIGVSAGAMATLDIQRVLGGSGDTGRTALRHRLGAWVSLDTGHLGWWDDGAFFFSAESHNDEEGADIVGAVQGIDRLRDPDFDRVSELWFEQRLADGLLRFKLGKIDPKSEFGYLRHSDNFLNNGFERSLATQGLPAPSTAAVLFINPTETIYAGVGVFDGAGQEGVATGRRGPSTFLGDPSDLFLIAEAGIRWGDDTGRPGRLGVGGWRHTGTFDRFDGSEASGTGGLFAVAEQRLWTASPDDLEDPRGIDAFAQYGLADGDVSLIQHHVSAGLQWTGAVPSRPLDATGVALSLVLLSDASAATADTESVIECFYRVHLTPCAFIQPDLQYVIHPGGVAERDDALVAGLRFGARF